MNSFSEQLAGLAAEGERKYAATPEPEDYAEQYVGAVRTRRRTRSALAGGAAAVVALIAIGAVLWFPTRTAEPALQPGEQIWRAQVAGDVWGEPGIGDGLVVVGDTAGLVTAFDIHSGEAVWKVDVAGPVRAGVTVARIDGEESFLVVSDDGRLTRVDAEGSVVWAVPAGTAVSERETYDQAAPAVVVRGDVGFVGGRDEMLRAFDLRTGEELWNVLVGAQVVATAAVDEHAVYVGDLDGWLTSFDAATGAFLWRTSIGSPIYSSPGVVDGVVVSGSRGTRVLGFDAANGERLWDVSLGSSWAESSVEAGDGVAYVGSSGGGQVLAIEAASGTVLWRTAVGGWPWARPTLADGLIYASTAWTPNQDPPVGSLQVLDAADGSAVWEAWVGRESAWAPDGPASGSMAPASVGVTPDGMPVVVVAGLDGSIALLAR